METTRVFYIGESQAVCIPKEYQFDVDEVYVTRIGNVLLLVPIRIWQLSLKMAQLHFPKSFWLKN